MNKLAEFNRTIATQIRVKNFQFIIREKFSLKSDKS